MKSINEEADAALDVLRISMYAKATVKVGPFARGGKSRVPTKATDHDFHPAATVTPVGIFLPASDELFLYGVLSKVTSDCLVDRWAIGGRRSKSAFPTSRRSSSIWTMVLRTIVGVLSLCNVSWSLYSIIMSRYV